MSQSTAYTIEQQQGQRLSKVLINSLDHTRCTCTVDGQALAPLIGETAKNKKIKDAHRTAPLKNKSLSSAQYILTILINANERAV